MARIRSHGSIYSISLISLHKIWDISTYIRNFPYHGMIPVNFLDYPIKIKWYGLNTILYRGMVSTPHIPDHTTPFRPVASVKGTLQGLMKVFSTLSLAYIEADLASLRIDDVKVFGQACSSIIALGSLYVCSPNLPKSPVPARCPLRTGSMLLACYKARFGDRCTTHGRAWWCNGTCVPALSSYLIGQRWWLLSTHRRDHFTPMPRYLMAFSFNARNGCTPVKRSRI